MDLGHWVTSLSTIPENPYGFIYIITNTITDRKYIGKKQMISNIRRKPLKGKTRVRRCTKESKWKTYTSSSKELNEDIIKYGINQFNFEILRFCHNKSQMAYF